MYFLAEEVSVMVLVIGGIFAFVGLVGIIGAIIKNSKCTEIIVATVKGYNERISHNEGGGRNITYSPVFEYQYDGNNYVKEYDFATPRKKYNVGEEVEIRINPSKPEVFVLGKVFSRLLFYFVFLAMGVVCALFYFKVL